MLKDNFKRIRIKHKLTQTQVAELLGVSRSTYTYYETGRFEPSADTFKKLVKIYSCSADDLLGTNQNKQLSVSSESPEYVSGNPAASLSKDEAMLLGYFRSVKNPEKILEFSEKLFNEENGQD